MKKLVIALMAVLLLTGCAAQPVQTESTLPPAETTIPTEPLPSIYVENSPMERGTGGAVRQYQLDTPVTGLGMLGDALLVCAHNCDCLFTCDSLDTANTGSNGELAHDAEGACLCSVVKMCTAAELNGVAAHVYNADNIAVLLTEESCSTLCSCLCDGHLADVDCVACEDCIVNDCLDLVQLLRCNSCKVCEVEAETVGLD